jgi:1-acyl-sn-glycerol-3-phosphate acyltransferase
VARRGDLNGWYRLGMVVFGPVFRVLFRLRVSGARNIPTRGPGIVAGNHVSAIDGVFLGLITAERSRRMTRFLVAAEFFENKKVAWGLRIYRNIPIRRGEGDTGALDEAIATIRGGGFAGIFPEGKVNPDPGGGLQRGRSGVGRIALATGAPVIPVGIWGTQERWPKTGLHWRRPWHPTVAFAYGEPIEPQGDPASPADVQVFVDLVMTGIAKQVEQARAIAEGRR